MCTARIILCVQVCRLLKILPVEKSYYTTPFEFIFFVYVGDIAHMGIECVRVRVIFLIANQYTVLLTLQ